MTDPNELGRNSEIALRTLLECHEPRKGNVLVVGCSTSSVVGKPLGSSGSREVAEAITKPLLAICDEAGLVLAVQGCEHINRSLVVPESFCEKRDLTPLQILPELKAGGAFAQAYYAQLGDEAIVVEDLGKGADYGIDIGGVLIGMHLRRDRTAVPVTIDVKIGCASVIGAYCRYKWAGGPRTHFVS
ncbi:MAG: DUF436 family protein [Planctomycetota bacterium]|nr:DUF436 family protein [Planctomycetota bacterium]